MGTGGDGVDWLETGPRSLTPAERRQRRTVVGCVLTVVVTFAVSMILTRPDSEATAPPPTPSGPITSSTPRLPTAARSTAPTSPGPVVVRRSGPIIPGFGPGVVYARTDDTVYRVELGTGRVVRTGGAFLSTTGPVAFLATATGVLLRPTDSVPGLLVPDGGAPRGLTGLLRSEGQVLAGPAGFFWVGRWEQGGPVTQMTLTRESGQATRTVVETKGRGDLLSDGAGGLLLRDVGGVWAVTPERADRITRGSVDGVGRHHYLITDCDERHRCSSYLYDRATKRQRRLERFPTGSFETGSLSPDGGYVARMRWSPNGERDVRVEHLKSGRPVATLEFGRDYFDFTASFVWTPDSRWLVGLDGGKLFVYDLTRGQLTTPDLGLRDLLQITARFPS